MSTSNETGTTTPGTTGSTTTATTRKTSRRRADRTASLRAGFVAVVPLGATLALAGVYPPSAFPILVASGLAFVAAKAESLFAPGRRWLDLSLLVFAIAAAAQLVPLPPALVDTLSPQHAIVRSFVSLDRDASWVPLTIDRAATRDGLVALISALLVFWAAREVLATGGLRAAARVVTIGGGLVAAIGLAQRATAPLSLLWYWTPATTSARPFGPFVNGNHFATWLLMAAAMACGYIAAHVRSHRLLDAPSWRLRIHGVLASGTVLVLAACAAAMIVTLLATASRGALAGAVVALVSGFALARRHKVSPGTRRLAAAALVGLLAVGAWLNLPVLLGRLASGGEVTRGTIWRETLPVIRDFPVTGTGLGTYSLSMIVYQQSRTEPHFNQAHSEYMQLLAEGGPWLALPALSALAAWIALARRRIREDRGEMLWARLGALVGIIGVSVHVIWESSLRVPANALLLALLAGIVVHQRRHG